MRPIAIPQMCNSTSAPFVRAYAPALADLDISEAEFISFIDSLNEAAQANPALAALDVTGNALRHVPILGLFGPGLAHLSKAGNAQISKKGVAAHVAQMSETLFKPKGLAVSICSGKALKRVIGSPDRPLLEPLDTLVPLAHHRTVWQRRMVGLQGGLASVRETTLPIANPGFTQKLKSSGTLSIMEREDHKLMNARRHMLKGKGQLYDQGDAEGKVAEQMGWLLIESMQ